MNVSMGSGVGQAFNCDGVKLVNGTQPPSHHNYRIIYTLREDLGRYVMLKICLQM